MQLYDEHAVSPKYVQITDVLYTSDKLQIDRVKTMTDQHGSTNVRRTDVTFLPEENQSQPDGFVPDIFTREDIIFIHSDNYTRPLFYPRYEQQKCIDAV